MKFLMLFFLFGCCAASIYEGKKNIYLMEILKTGKLLSMISTLCFVLFTCWLFYSILGLLISAKPTHASLNLKKKKNSEIKKKKKKKKKKNRKVDVWTINIAKFGNKYYPMQKASINSFDWKQRMWRNQINISVEHQSNFEALVLNYFHLIKSFASTWNR